MYKKLIAVLILAFLCADVFAAGVPGSPTARLQRGQWATGYNYSYSTQRLDKTTMKWVSRSFNIDGSPSGDPSFYTTEAALRRFNVHRHYWNVNYGVRDWWEVYLQLGFADPKADLKDENLSSRSITKLAMNFDNDTAIGWGTRCTFWNGEWRGKRASWGTALQMNWLRSQWRRGGESSGTTWQETADLRTWDMLLSVGPRIDVGTWWLYGGPFYYYLSGKFDRQRTDTYPQCHIAVQKGHSDVEARHIGAFVGAEFELTQRISTILEYAFTGNSWAVGTAIRILLN